MWPCVGVYACVCLMGLASLKKGALCLFICYYLFLVIFQFWCLLSQSSGMGCFIGSVHGAGSALLGPPITPVCFQYIKLFIFISQSGSSEEGKTMHDWFFFFLFCQPTLEQICCCSSLRLPNPTPLNSSDLGLDGYQRACPTTWPRHVVAWQRSKGCVSKKFVLLGWGWGWGWGGECLNSAGITHLNLLE